MNQRWQRKTDRYTFLAKAGWSLLTIWFLSVTRWKLYVGLVLVGLASWSFFSGLSSEALAKEGEIFAAPSGQKLLLSATGYYSPLPDQEFYLTGSYASEIRLNGQGKMGADGTPVYPGMMAAAPHYPFGTKICVPNFGCGTVHDRGQAIVAKGVRNIAKGDRIDLWMGYGEEGLRRALAWGLQHVEATVYPVGTPIADSVNFSAPVQLADLVDFPRKISFDQNLSLKSQGESVKELQKYLQKLGYLTVAPNGYYGEKTQAAVRAFQLDHFIIPPTSPRLRGTAAENVAGAGRFGPQTRTELANVIYHDAIQEKIREMWKSFQFENDLSRGKRNADVARLQRLLVQEELLLVSPTGFFGPKTQAALKEFQLRHGVIQRENQAGAGNFGPKTREKMNELLTARQAENSAEKKLALAYQKVRGHFSAFALQ